MKIRYIIKHLFFRISRAFYHARKFLAVFGLCLILLVSLFVTSASAAPAGYEDIFYSDVAQYKYGISLQNTSNQSINRNFWKSWNATVNTGDYLTGPYKHCYIWLSLYEDVIGEDIDNAFGLALSPEQTIVVYLTFDFVSSPIADSSNFQTSLSLAFSQGLVPDDVYERYSVTNLKNGSSRMTAELFYTNTKGFTLYLNALGFLYDYSSGSNPSNFSFALKEAKYRYLSPEEAATKKLESTINNQTATITNGWDGKGTPPAGGSVAGDLTAAEDALMSSQSSGIQQSTELFSSIGTQLQQFTPAFLAVSSFMDDMFSVPLFSLLITLSLSLGIIALLLNLAPAIKSSVEYNKRQEARKKGKSG